jgi:hypothetical protein
MTTMGTAIAAARAPLEIPVLFDGAALDEVGPDCVVVEEDPVVFILEADEDPDVLAAPAWKRVKLNPPVTTLPFDRVLICLRKVLTTVAESNPAQKASASDLQVDWLAASLADPARHCVYILLQIKFGIVLVYRPTSGENPLTHVHVYDRSF